MNTADLKRGNNVDIGPTSEGEAKDASHIVQEGRAARSTRHHAVSGRRLPQLPSGESGNLVEELRRGAIENRMTDRIH
ncbi:hypothetical protein GCM10010319_38720 [Streptomyces blastmyceticus]|uniref:Uncharacterized protein n=1 Tax=Streptomyces blastmyceticus TaxID=68180 RepID=A0ABP3H005_9ACTN